MAIGNRARVYFAPERGTFWFAAGLSFNSFALVDGTAVVAIQIGGGFELSLLGLARMRRRAKIAGTRIVSTEFWCAGHAIETLPGRPRL